MKEKEDDFTNDPEWERIAIQIMKKLEELGKQRPYTSK